MKPSEQMATAEAVVREIEVLALGMKLCSAAGGGAGRHPAEQS